VVVIWRHRAIGDTFGVSRQNVDLIRRGFEHFVATGEPAWDTLHDHVEARDHDIMDGREYRGHAGVRQCLFEDWAAAWSDYSAQPEEFIDVDDERVIAVFRIKATGRGSGIEIERRDAILYVLRDQQVIRVDYYNNKQQALEAAAG
jgi:ketosteroid isomerase-like protein